MYKPEKFHNYIFMKLSLVMKFIKIRPSKTSSYTVSKLIPTLNKQTSGAG